MDMTLILSVVVAAGGLAVAAAGVRRRQLAADPTAYIHDLERGDGARDREGDAFSSRLRLPFLTRVLRPLCTGLVDRISALTPGNHVRAVHRKLLLAGLTTSIRAEEFVTIQAITTAAGLALGVLGAALFSLSTNTATLTIVLLPTVGALGPASWLTRRAQDRQDAILMDLPDVVDLLAISVEAGVGFEGALEIVCAHFDSPLAEELSRTLKEMELGLPRREALQNLKKRTDVPDLSNFVLALTQADALGMPIGRILHTQATEMRNKRRARAREKAAKLPVKILFPLVLFIFPAVLVVILGPAMVSVAKAL